MHVTSQIQTRGGLASSANEFTYKPGDIVRKGNVIGRLVHGRYLAGMNSHLHFEIRDKSPNKYDLYPNDNGRGYYKSDEKLRKDGFISPSVFIANYNKYAPLTPKLKGKMILKGKLAVNAYKPRKGSNFNLWKANSKDKDQRWVFKRNGLIQREGTNYCLKSRSKKKFGKVSLWTCNSKDRNQKWQRKKLRKGYTQIRLKGSKYCLIAYKPKHKSKVKMYRCNSKNKYQWFKIASKVKKSKSKSKMILKSNLAINAYKPRNGSKFNLWKANSKDKDQRWVFKRNGLIQRAGTKFCLNTNQRKNLGKVFMWKCNSKDPDQRWKLIKLDNGYKQIKLKNTNFCLNAYKPRHKSRVNIYICNRRDKDQWFKIK